MKHIVIDARTRPSSTGRYIDRLIEHLQILDTQNRYTVLLKPGDTWRPSSPNWTTKKCDYALFSFNPLQLVTFGLFLRRLKPDLVHFGMTPQEPLWCPAKRITTTHDLTMLRFARPGRLPVWLHELRMMGYRFLFWHSHKVSARIIVPTKFVAKDLAKHHLFTSNKTSVTYEASEPPIKAVGQNLKVAKLTKPFLLHVGSPFPHKNIDRLVTAFEILKQKHPELRLVLAGKKEFYFEALEKHIATSKFRGDIIVPGFVSDAELKWLYQNAEAYVLPSLSEGFGLPGLEAMAHGCPLLSSNTTCLPEVYGDAAVYFDPKNIDDMTDAIGSIIGNSQLRKALVQKGYTQLKKYSWRRMAEETLAIYQNVLR